MRSALPASGWEMTSVLPEPAHAIISTWESTHPIAACCAVVYAVTPTIVPPGSDISLRKE